jgi:protein gp37
MHVTENGCWNGKTCFVPSELEKPYKWRKPRSVFISSMGDIFHDSVPFAWVERVLGMVASNPQHTFIMLTKRAKRMQEFFASSEMAGQLACLYQLAAGTNPETCQQDNCPLPNLALGVSVENQETADERIPYLLSTLAAKRFVSLEPMLGPVNLDRIHEAWDTEEGSHCESWESCLDGRRFDPWSDGWAEGYPKLDGVILGGESGNNGRRLDPMWVMEVRDQCAAAGVPFMFKQWNHENRNVVDPDTGFPLLGSQTYSGLAW